VFNVKEKPLGKKKSLFTKQAKGGFEEDIDRVSSLEHSTYCMAQIPEYR